MYATRYNRDAMTEPLVITADCPFCFPDDVGRFDVRAGRFTCPHCGSDLSFEELREAVLTSKAAIDAMHARVMAVLNMR